TGVVLAGGRSSRFGRDKLAEPLHGVPVLHHTVRRVADVCDEVVVVISPGAPEPELPAGIDARFARDVAEGEGPLAGASAGLLATRTELAVLAGGDMPELSTPVLFEMLRVAREAPVDAVALQDGDRFRPLPCVVRVTAARDHALALLHGGRRRLRNLLDTVRVAVIDESTWTGLDPERRTLFDVDEPADLLGGDGTR
ncbi:MAG: molybdenum cofactor guanylyltransferase, partial [Actinomycetota bacterium]